MSFHWIKVETNTPDKPEVIAMARVLRLKDPDTVTGKLLRVWAWADANSVDGHNLSITPEFIDRITACRGFARAMQAVGWLQHGENGLLSFPGFERHNGESAKKRAMESRKKQRQRGTKAGQEAGQMSRSEGGQNGGPEKEKEKNSTTTTARVEPPDHEKLLGAYARPSFDRPALEAAAACLRRFTGTYSFAQILAGVQNVTRAVALWTEDERAVYLPTAANFFEKDGWRKHPDEWASKREAKKRTAGGRAGGMTQEEIQEALGGRA